MRTVRAGEVEKRAEEGQLVQGARECAPPCICQRKNSAVTAKRQNPSIRDRKKPSLGWCLGSVCSTVSFRPSDPAGLAVPTETELRLIAAAMIGENSRRAGEHPAASARRVVDEREEGSA